MVDINRIISIVTALGVFSFVFISDIHYDIDSEWLWILTVFICLLFNASPVQLMSSYVERKRK